MKIINWVKKIFAPKKIVVYHVGHTKLLVDKRVEYRFIKYTTFAEEGMLIEMWGRIFTSLTFMNADIILLDFKHKGIINAAEEKELSKFGVVLKLNDA